MTECELRWNKEDFENKLGFESKKSTGTSAILTLILGALMAAAFYGALFPLYSKTDYQTIKMFFHGGDANRSTIPYYIVFIAGWSLAILLIKILKLKLQRKALNLALVPEEPDFIINPHTAREIISTIYKKVDEPRRFLLLNRIERSLANLKNIGRVSDVAEGFVMQADHDESYMESTYTILKTFLWAIPVLGFIGTVLGLSKAIGGFGAVVSKGAALEELKVSLSGVTGGLAIAFETTLIALVAALVLQLLIGFVRKREEDFLDECSDYCHRYIVSRLRTFDPEGH